MQQQQDDEKHPHVKSGPKGGQFATKGGAGSSIAPTQPRSSAVPENKWPGYQPGKAKGKGKPSAAPAAPAVLHTLTRRGPNDPGEVKNLQQLINKLGLGPIAEDGSFGSETEGAVKKLQTKLGISPTGHASPSVARRLRDAAALSPCVKASAGPVSLVMASGALGPSMRGVELARPGTWQLSTGKRTFTAENLQDAADFFKATGEARIPLGFGHADPRFDGDPAFGWVANIRYAEDAKGPVLLGDLVDMDDWLAAAAPRRWPNRSIEGFANLEFNGRVYSLALNRLALLGSTAPAMPNLRSLADIRKAIAAAAAASSAEFVSASAPSEKDTQDPALRAVVPSRETKEAGMDPAKFREVLGLDDDISDDEVMEALVESGFVAPADPVETPVAAAAETVVASGTIRVDASAWQDREDRIKKLEASAQRARDGERDQIIATAVQEGKFPPARREHWVRLWNADPEGTRAVIATLARNVVPIAATGYSGEGDADLDEEFAHLFPPTAQQKG